ncbi:MAG: beta-N-acetylhexosaminidase, partial [Alistipes sp.]|nr:beta-N-acetylhexosaminidase [Alistipes sp.]
MKKITLLLLAIIIGLPMTAIADSNINLTPVPMKMTVGSGKLVLPESFTIATIGIDDEMAAEAKKFSKLFAEISGYSVSVANEGDALITMSRYTGNEELGNEGYTLDITADGIAITANSATGFYYAFQSVKKMLPANVMAEVKDEKVTEYSLPVVSIVDAPRFEWRGFMLDVSRHYFTTDQIKRMIDVMSYYKMNRFHWHLTDDQGWRFEVKKYPRLTTVGAVRNNSWSVDPEYGGYYINEPYGPYFYTQDECREIVAYAAERHIDVVPEVEFPGHSCAVNTAYPEFSCWPNGSHSVQVNGGIYSDVLNVANPQAVQFVKDVIDEVIEVFPYHQIHIGGDETPTSAWQGNAECQALMQKMGYSNVRELQSHFVREISDYVTSKEGDKKRTVIMWN